MPSTSRSFRACWSPAGYTASTRTPIWSMCSSASGSIPPAESSNSRRVSGNSASPTIRFDQTLSVGATTLRFERLHSNDGFPGHGAVGSSHSNGWELGWVCPPAPPNPSHQLQSLGGDRQGARVRHASSPDDDHLLDPQQALVLAGASLRPTGTRCMKSESSRRHGPR